MTNDETRAALIAEVENLRSLYALATKNSDIWCESTQIARKERDQLKAEMESLSHAASAEADMADEFKRERDAALAKLQTCREALGKIRHPEKKVLAFVQLIAEEALEASK